MNALSKTGYLLSVGKLAEAQTTASGPWVAELKRAVASTGAAGSSGDAALAALATLQRAASEDAAKVAYVATAKALNAWTAEAGLTRKLSGL